MLFSKEQSCFMDIARFSAAMWVLLTHAYQIWFPENSAKIFHYGHSAVVIFFVLSGYVIENTTKNKTATQYAVARLSSLYSVLIPSLCIVFLIEISLKYLNIDQYQLIHRGASLPRYLMCLSYTNEIWFLSTAPPIDEPLWSLSFEFAYYLIFGLFFFRKKIKHFNLIFIATCIFFGPKILLMMPIWLMGVLVAKMKKLKITYSLSFLLVFLSLACAVWLVMVVPEYPYVLGTKPWFFAAGFITDAVVGIFVAAAFYFFPKRNAVFNNSHGRLYYYLRILADLAFPIYILHGPLLVLFKTLYKFQENNLMQLVLVIISVLFISLSLGLIMRKYKKAWIVLFNNVVVFVININLFRPFFINNKQNEKALTI